MNTEQIEALNRMVDLVIANLPDSITARKAALHDLLTLVGPKSPRRQRIAQLLLHLHDHERAQLSFLELMKEAA